MVGLVATVGGMELPHALEAAVVDARNALREDVARLHATRRRLEAALLALRQVLDTQPRVRLVAGDLAVVGEAVPADRQPAHAPTRERIIGATVVFEHPVEHLQRRGVAQECGE